MENRNLKGFVLWFSGLSAAGKTTVADEVFRLLEENGNTIERLDGDIVRDSLTNKLSFSKEDRDENIKRIGFVSGLLAKNGVGVISSFITPYEEQRKNLRKNIKNFILVYVKTSLETCEKRDPKGLYEKARKGEIKNFTGVSDPYEIPENAEIVVDTEKLSPEESAQEVFEYLKEKKLI